MWLLTPYPGNRTNLQWQLIPSLQSSMGVADKLSLLDDAISSDSRQMELPAGPDEFDGKSGYQRSMIHLCLSTRPRPRTGSLHLVRTVNIHNAIIALIWNPAGCG
jgi:hypothetical protein